MSEVNDFYLGVDCGEGRSDGVDPFQHRNWIKMGWGLIPVVILQKRRGWGWGGFLATMTLNTIEWSGEWLVT